MFATAVIAFREFLEAFLITGVFLGISRKLDLKKEKEIGIAAGIGMLFSLLLSTGVYIFGDHARGVLTEKNADFLESYILIFSGIFIAYVSLSLHGMLNRSRGAKLLSAHKKLEANSFDISLFFTIIFLVIREGFEVALFTASTSLFSAFMQNFIGLLLGFIAASAVGITTFFAYIKFPIGKVFRTTEYLIVLLGAGLVQNGITKLFETHFGISLSDMLSFHLNFLPSEDTWVGHILQGLIGIDAGFSGVRLLIMLIYIGIVYMLFLRRKMAAVEVKRR